MCILRKEFLQDLFPGVLIFVLVISACTKQIQSSDEIPIRGAVCSVHRSDGSQYTYIDLAIGPQFSGKLPDDIDSIIVSGPHGDFSLKKDDFNYSPQWRSFWHVRPGVPEIGTYTFKVTSGNRNGLATDIQSNVKSILLPDTKNFCPARGETVTCISPLFSWHILNNDRQLFYQVEIRDANREHVYRTDYIRDMESVRLPPGILKSSESYQWRVRVADGADWLTLNNRSQSKWITFSTHKVMDGCKYSYRTPLEADDDWGTSSLDAQGVDRQKIQELIHLVLTNQFKNIHSILLIKNSKLILEEYFCGYHRNLKHPVASVTKSVTSILFGIASKQGQKVILDDKLIKYLPEYKDLISTNAKSDITLEHLLTMRAGLEWNELHTPTNLQHMIESSEPIQYVLERKLVDPPGQKFFYNTGLSTVLGRVLKNTTGLDADQFAARYLFAPLGIKDYTWGKLPDGTLLTGSDLYLRPRDMAKLGYLYLKDGAWKDQQIVPQKWVRESIYPHVQEGELISGTAYGYQWWRGASRIGDREIDSFYAAGHGGQFIAMIPSLDVIIVTTSQVGDNNAGDFRAYSIIENYIIPAVLKEDPTLEILPFRVENYRRITGNYRWPKAKLKLKIFIENGKLYGETILFDGKFRLFPVTEGRFMCVSEDVGNFWLDIIEDSNRNIEGIKLIIGFSNIPFKRTRGLLFGF